LVYSIYDSTEVAIQKMIEASQRMISVNSQGELGGINSVIKKHYELQIKTLQNAPRDPDNLERLLKVKERQKDEAMYMEDTQRLVTEIEMLKVVLYLVCRNNRRSKAS
jgi:demethoxyubiquinone hydroxylase (CLK1/Coq7/Cat5 family)